MSRRPRVPLSVNLEAEFADENDNFSATKVSSDKLQLWVECEDGAVTLNKKQFDAMVSAVYHIMKWRAS